MGKMRRLGGSFPLPSVDRTLHLMSLSPNKQAVINQQSIDIRSISLKSETNLTLPGADIDNRLVMLITYAEKLQIK